MGLLFSIFPFVIIVAVISLIIATISLIGVKSNRKQRFFTILTSPIAATGSFITVAVILCLILTSITRTDIGAGDFFYVPLRNGYSLSFIDSPDHPGTIEYKGKEVVSGVDSILLEGNTVYGINGQKKDSYFILDTKSSLLTQGARGIDATGLVKAGDFYYKRFWELNLIGFILVFICSIAASYFVTKSCKQWIRRKFLDSE